MSQVNNWRDLRDDIPDLFMAYNKMPSKSDDVEISTYRHCVKEIIRISSDILTAVDLGTHFSQGDDNARSLLIGEIIRDDIWPDKRWASDKTRFKLMSLIKTARIILPPPFPTQTKSVNRPPQDGQRGPKAKSPNPR
jgi:hypothetical protein